eukprot:5827487-Amphidinium_carterae.1
MEQFVESKSFTLLKKYRLKVEHHINVQRTAVKWLTRDPRFDHSRIVFAVDSLVLQSVITRGRSRSRKLNRVASAAGAFMLFSDIYPLMSWIRTEHNPADDPTRHAELRKGKTLPDVVQESIENIGEICPWVLAATKSMWLESGLLKEVDDEEPNRVEARLFDSTKGFPGEGPFGRPRAATEQVPRQDLRVRVEPKTALRYVQKLRMLSAWLEVNQFPPLEQLEQLDTRVINKVLGSYVQFLHYTGRPTQWGTDTLAGVQFAAPNLQGHLKEAWSMQRQWCRITPMQTRTPLPLEILLAMCSVCVVWNWRLTAASLLLGFHLLLRPGELAAVLRHHLLLPTDVGGSLESGTLALPKTKTSNRGSRLQSVIIEDSGLLQIMDVAFGAMPARSLLCPGGLPVLAQKFAVLKKVLQLEHTPFSLASLRGGGSVHYMRTVGNVSWLQYRGRWESAKSMGHYLQAGTAMLSMAQIPEAAKARIKTLAQLAPTLLLP